jgi:hypothetical protein
MIDALTETKSKPRVSRLNNPRATTWEALLLPVIMTLEIVTCGETRIEIVSPQTWLQRVKADVESSGKDVESAIKVNPAVKSLSTYGTLLVEDMPVVETGRAASMSRMLREVLAIKPEWMGRWCEEWLSQAAKGVL